MWIKLPSILVANEQTYTWQYTDWVEIETEHFTMTIDFEAEAHMADLRMRVLAQLDAEKRGEPFTPISPDEYRFLVLDLLRGRDMAAARARTDAATLRKAKSSPKPAPAPLDLQEILDQLS